MALQTPIPDPRRGHQVVAGLGLAAKAYAEGGVIPEGNAESEMDDLDTRIRQLSDLDRVSLIRALIRVDAQAEARTRGAGSRARLGTSARNRADNARNEMARLGRIIYFLRFRSPLPGGDEALCEMLAEKLNAKGQWTGECHPEY